MSKTREDFYILASGEILTSYLPEDWKDWAVSDLDSWLEGHAWSPYEQWGAQQLWDRIISMSLTMLEVHNNAVGEAK
jgi:hypothetical protein